MLRYIDTAFRKIAIVDIAGRQGEGDNTAQKDHETLRRLSLRRFLPLVGQEQAEVIRFAIVDAVQHVGQPFDRVDVVDFTGTQE